MSESKDKRTELEQSDEATVMLYLDILKYAKHHCPNGENPYDIADHVFVDEVIANR